jgi:hypothetical protein
VEEEEFWVVELLQEAMVVSQAVAGAPAASVAAV